MVLKHRGVELVGVKTEWGGASTVKETHWVP